MSDDKGRAAAMLDAWKGDALGIIAHLQSEREALLLDVVSRLAHFRDDVALQCHPWQEAGAAAVYRVLVKDCDALISRIEEALY